MRRRIAPEPTDALPGSQGLDDLRGVLIVAGCDDNSGNGGIVE